MTIMLSAYVPAYATPVSVVVTGIQTASYYDPNSLLPFPVPDASTSWLLTFTYQGETPDSRPNDPVVGDFAGAITAISLTIGSNTFQPFANNRVLVLNDNGNPDVGYSDVWQARTFDDASLQSSFGLTLLNFGGQAVNSDALVAPSWPFPPWNFGSIEYVIGDPNTPNHAQTSAQVTGLAVVPVPATFWLLGTACLGVMGSMRRKCSM
ncbi:MAG: VPLPA-CTERM sorting domain-containing protein [Gammaproteobacteria bacterium]